MIRIMKKSELTGTDNYCKCTRCERECMESELYHVSYEESKKVSSEDVCWYCLLEMGKATYRKCLDEIHTVECCEMLQKMSVNEMAQWICDFVKKDSGVKISYETVRGWVEKTIANNELVKKLGLKVGDVIRFHSRDEGAAFGIIFEYENDTFHNEVSLWRPKEVVLLENPKIDSIKLINSIEDVDDSAKEAFHEFLDEVRTNNISCNYKMG